MADDAFCEWWEALRASSPAPPVVMGVPSHARLRCTMGSLRVLPPRLEAVEAWSFLRDALELLTLLSLVDAAAFQRVLREFCAPSYDADWRDFEFPPNAAPLPIDIRIDDDVLGDGHATAWASQLLAIVLTPVPLSMRTRKFRNARKLLLDSVASESERRSLEDHFVLPVRVSLYASAAPAAVALVGALANFQQQREKVHGRTTERREEVRRAALRVFPFRLESIKLAAEDTTLSPSLLSSIHRHFMSGALPLHEVCLLGSDDESSIDRRAFANFVTAVCAPNGPSVINDVPHRTGAKALRIEASMALNPFMQVCSALTFSTGVEELFVDEMLDPNVFVRRQRWAMLLYALFSSEADNDLQLLDLGDFELSTDDLAWMKALFEAHHPIERLQLYAMAQYPSPEDVATLSDRITVASGATLRPCRGFQALFDIQTHKPLSFYTFRGWGGDTEVIAPAFGNTVVPHEHILQREPIIPQTHKWWKLESHGIKSLVIRSFGDADGADYVQRMRNLGEFITIIGRPLESLSLLCDLPQPEEFLDLIWSTCVHLVHLEICFATFQSLEYLVNAYESGKCTVRSLRLDEVQVRDVSSLNLFAAALADPTTRVARTLVELRFFLKDEHEAFGSGQHCAALVYATKTNESLRYLSVNADAAYYENIKPLYDDADNSWIPGFTTRERFPLNSKCAFLSVVEWMNRQDQVATRRAMAQLDSRILSLVFELAGTALKRTVIVRQSD